MLNKYEALREEIKENKDVQKIMVDEQFIPPHKSAAFTPYDCVICIDPTFPDVIQAADISVKKEEISQKIESMISNVEYDRIVGTTVNDTAEPGDYLVYISLVAFENRN